MSKTLQVVLVAVLTLLSVVAPFAFAGVDDTFINSPTVFGVEPEPQAPRSGDPDHIGLTPESQAPRGDSRDGREDEPQAPSSSGGDKIQI